MNLLEKVLPRIIRAFVHNQGKEISDLVLDSTLEAFLLASFFLFKQGFHDFDKMGCQLDVVRRVSVIDELDHQVICQIIIALDWKTYNLCQDGFNLGHDIIKLVLVDLSHNLMILDGQT